MLRKIQSENRKIAKDNLANAAALAAAETNAKTALARDLALALEKNLEIIGSLLKGSIS